MRFMRKIAYFIHSLIFHVELCKEDAEYIKNLVKSGSSKKLDTDSMRSDFTEEFITAMLDCNDLGVCFLSKLPDDRKSLKILRDNLRCEYAKKMQKRLDNIFRIKRRQIVLLKKYNKTKNID